MPGQCYACGTEFSFFKKEHGCKNCGFAFCSKCLTKKATIPKEKLKDNKDSIQHVCNRCFDILTGKATEENRDKFAPPEAYLKRMAALEQGVAQGKQPQAAEGGKVKIIPKFTALDPADRQIAERLEKLKERPEVPASTDKDLNERLARLKGEDPAARTAPAKPVYHPPDRRTEVEQIDDLLEEIANEVEIDSHRPDPAAYVEGRLAKLREEKDDKKKQADEQNNLDKNNLSNQKYFVKNIDVGLQKPKTEGASKHAAGSTGGEEVDIEEVHALMAKAATQMEVEALRLLEGMKKDKELMERLAEVKQRQKDKDHQQVGAQNVESNVDNANEEEEDSEDEEAAAKRIMKQFMEEVKLDQQLEAGSDTSAKGKAENKPQTEKDQKKGENKQTNVKGNTAKDDDEYEDPDELPYCIICTEDAVVRCIDCDMDLYCNKCFNTGHKELGFTDHRSVPYKAPKGYQT